MNISVSKWCLDDCIVNIYKAALDGECWSSVLTYFSQILGLGKASLIMLNADTGLWNTIAACSITDEDSLGNREIANIRFNCVAINTCRGAEGAMSTLDIRFLANAEMLISMPVWDDFYAVLVCKSYNVESSLAEKFIKNLFPHVVESLKIRRHIDSIQHTKNFLSSALKGVNSAMLVLNSQAEILFLSEEAEGLLRHHPAMDLSYKGKIRLYYKEDHLKFETTIQQFFTGELVGRGDIMVRHPDKERPLRIFFRSLHAAVSNKIAPNFLVLTINDPERPCALSSHYLCQVFSLTPSEVQIAHLMADGYKLPDIATSRKVTLETARWQVKQLLQKTRTHSQAELVRLLFSLNGDVSRLKIFAPDL